MPRVRPQELGVAGAVGTVEVSVLALQVQQALVLGLAVVRQVVAPVAQALVRGLVQCEDRAHGIEPEEEVVSHARPQALVEEPDVDQQLALGHHRVADLVGEPGVRRLERPVGAPLPGRREVPVHNLSEGIDLLDARHDHHRGRQHRRGQRVEGTLQHPGEEEIVVVELRDPPPLGGADAGVQGGCQAAVRAVALDPDPRVRLKRHGGVGAVVNDNDLQVPHRLREHACHSPRQRFRAVVGGDHHGYKRRAVSGHGSRGTRCRACRERRRRGRRHTRAVGGGARRSRGRCRPSGTAGPRPRR